MLLSCGFGGGFVLSHIIVLATRKQNLFNHEGVVTTLLNCVLRLCQDVSAVLWARISVNVFWVGFSVFSEHNFSTTVGEL